MIRICKKCGVEKHISNFSKEKQRKDGLNAACKECRNLASKEWASNNSERVAANVKKWRKDNPDRVKEYRSKSYYNNSEHVALKNKKWAANNPVARRNINRLSSQNRDKRIKLDGGKLSTGLVAKLLMLQRGKCACGCGKPLNNEFHMDHRMPIAKGGRHHDDNMQLLLPLCNMQKNAKDPIDFMQSRGFLL